MPQINQQLLERLRAKLGVGQAQIYKRIEAVANETLLDRHLAALMLASQNGINIHKYSSAGDRATLRNSSSSNGFSAAQTVDDDDNPPERPARKIPKTKKPAKSAQAKDNSVFVVHGRNEALRKSMFEFLRALGLKPLEWEKALLLAKGVNPLIDDILDTAMAKVQAVVVLFSPDDEAKLRDDLWTRSDGAVEKKLRGQPRPNVIFEAGLALGRHPEKTLLVQVGAVRGFSDVAGKHLVRLTNDYGKRNDLANRLKKIGCKVDRDGTDWTKAGDFTA